MNSILDAGVVRDLPFLSVISKSVLKGMATRCLTHWSSGFGNCNEFSCMGTEVAYHYAIAYTTLNQEFTTGP